MKFYSYSNENNDYIQAVSLTNVRCIYKTEGSGKSVIRFGVCIEYCDGKCASFSWLKEAEAKKVYKEILELLNK